MTRIAGTPPAACAACYGQYPEMLHVDFEAAYDGPVIEGSQRVYIDDLVLCEGCVREAARLVGMVEETKRIAALEREAAEQRARADDAERRLTNFRRATAALDGATPDPPAPKPKPRAARRHGPKLPEKV